MLLIYAGQTLYGGQPVGLSNWFVGDGLGLRDTLRDLVQGSSWNTVQFSKGLLLFYLPAFSSYGTIAFFVLNSMVALYVAVRYGASLLLLCPFLLVSLALPSKDLLVLVLTLESVRHIRLNQYGSALLILGSTYFVRDGAFVIGVAVTVVLVASLRGYNSRRVVIIFFGLATFVFAAQHLLLSDLGIYVRNMQAYSTSSSLGCCSAADYWVRVFANATNWALRPAVFDLQGGVSLLGIAHFISGLTMLYVVSASFYAFGQASPPVDVKFGALVFLTALAVVSLNPHVQPRYLLPYALAFLYVSNPLLSPYTRVRLGGVTLLIVLAGWWAYSLSGIPNPPRPPVVLIRLFNYPI